MGNPPTDLGDLAHAIQLALAPVFLLTGIAGILNVMTGRLARIIDRGRYLTERELPPAMVASSAYRVELASLEFRRHLASSAIAASTLSALLVCVVIASLFVQVLLQVELRWVVGAMFTGSTLALVVGLGYFLREVHLATKTVRIPSATPSA
ncbi:MAG: DUF2721 domain-containing protein [Gemmatimonadetes bacterium]|nr:DUF2721 domain-containing protein [Gemmatimonadota bacterium]MBK9549484.1 DUF2721 domain-containing protein [Gemmatimonadota bacterium]MBP9898233.1 DUF2721 domain-containing protein [Gemmatimonadales bacterium]